MKREETKRKIPILVTASGHTKQECQDILNEAQEKINDHDFVSKLHDVFKENNISHSYRGYAILGDEKTMEIDEIGERKPVWFLVTGYGGLWPGMGCEFMNIESYRHSIERSSKALESVGVNLVDKIMNSDKETFNSMITYSSAMIAANQMALVDVYSSVGVKPDGFIGVSLGEVACAYIDGCLTLEQSNLLAYWRGKYSKEIDLMATRAARVPLTWKEAAKICPADVCIGGSVDGISVYVAGETSSVSEFVKELNEKGIPAKLSKYPMPFHTKYMASAAEKLKTKADEIIPNPRKKSQKWLSTSIPVNKWDTGRLCNGEYFAKSLISPNNFYETVQMIPENSITIQIELESVEGKNQMVAKVIRQNTPGHIGAHETVRDLLKNIGKLYIAGSQTDVGKLYRSNGAMHDSVRKYHSRTFTKMYVKPCSNESNLIPKFKQCVSQPRSELYKACIDFSKALLKLVSIKK